VGGTTVVNASDSLGTISFQGSDGTELVEAASITTLVDGTPGANDMPGAPTTADGASSPTERMRIDSSGRVGIGTTSADQLLVVSQNAASYNPAIKISNPNTGRWGGKLIFESANGASVYNAAVIKADGGGGFGSGVLIVETAGSERCRVDGSGRLLIGTSTARANLNNVGQTARFQLEGTTNDTNKLLIVSNFSTATNAVGAGLYLARAGSTVVGSNAVVAANNVLGEVVFSGSDGTDFVQAALIQAEVDGTPGANDMPGRLVFSTTADGASSPTERMRLNSSGQLLVGTSSARTGRKLQVEGDGLGVYGALTFQKYLAAVPVSTTTEIIRALGFVASSNQASAYRVTVMATFAGATTRVKEYIWIPQVFQTTGTRVLSSALVDEANNANAAVRATDFTVTASKTGDDEILSINVTTTGSSAPANVEVIVLVQGIGGRSSSAYPYVSPVS
jgi:hypothetical protein